MSRLRFLLIAVISMVNITANAFDFDEGGIAYNYLRYGNNVEVTGQIRGYSGELTIPRFVTHSGETYNVIGINYETFKDCKGLHTLRIPNTITYIDDNLNTGGDILNIHITNLSAWFNMTRNTSTHGYRLYLNGEKITDLNIPEGVKEIQKGAFAGWRDLTSITFPASVKKFSEYAFTGFPKNIRVNITDLSAWCGITKETNSYYPGIFTNEFYHNGKKITDLKIPEGVETIEDYAFCGWENLTSVTFPNTVKVIGNSSFGGCSSLAVYIQDLLSWCKIVFRSIHTPGISPQKLYINGEEITDLKIPEGVDTIEGYAFYGWKNLTSVSISSSVKSIESKAFNDCINITSVNIGDSVKTIDYAAFENCKKIKSVRIPNSVTEIGTGAFRFCDSLTSVTIGSVVNNMGTQVFMDCPIKEVYVLAKEAFACETNIFDNSVYGNAILHVPEGSEESYYKTAPWGNFFNIQSIPTGIENVKSEQPNVNNPVFNLNGIRMEKANGLPSGVYIKEGKKYFVK